jgi:exonuclease III
METVEIATLNINGIITRTRVEMFEDVIQQHDLYILFVQEVTSPVVMNMRG